MNNKNNLDNIVISQNLSNDLTKAIKIWYEKAYILNLSYFELSKLHTDMLKNFKRYGSGKLVLGIQCYSKVSLVLRLDIEKKSWWQKLKEYKKSKTIKYHFEIEDNINNHAILNKKVIKEKCGKIEEAFIEAKIPIQTKYYIN